MVSIDQKMTEKVISRYFGDLIVLLVAAGAVTCLWYWLSYDPTADISVSVPGTDGFVTNRTGAGNSVKIGEFFASYAGVAGNTSFSWPRFRGADSNNISADSVPLIENIDGNDISSRVLWSVSLGEGHAGAAVHNGRVYVLDYDEENRADTLRCFSFADGTEIWRRWYAVEVKRNHGMSRTVPAVNDEYVVTIGPRCHVMGTDALTGDFLWGIDLVEELNAKVPLWYTGQCPLIDGNQAVIAVGGDLLLAGIDCESGEILWSTPNIGGYQMSHSSVMVMDIHGRRTYVYAALGAIVGVSAEQEDRGALLWSTKAFDATVIAPSPVYLEEGRIFATAGYGAGSLLFEVIRDGDSFSTEVVYRRRPKEGFACEQQTPIVFDGHLLGIMPKDAGPLRNQFVCAHPDGDIVWSSGETDRFGLGPFLIADDKLLILSDDGELTLARASTRAYEVLGRFTILDGFDAWAPLALVDGKLLARDSKTLVCVDLQHG